MYFLTQGFPRWDGYSIYNDPEVSVMVSKGTTPTFLTITIATTRSANSYHQHRANTTSTKPKPIKWTITKTQHQIHQTNQTTPNPTPMNTPPSGTTTPKTTTSTSNDMPSMIILVIVWCRRNWCSRFIDAGRSKKNRKKN